MKNKNEYIKEIDVLRAISVLAVLFYHLYENVIPFGYLGVDVFFVISGFVVTRSLISKNVESPYRTVVNFFKRRIRRLLPPLIITILLTFLLTIFFIPFKQSHHDLFLMTGIYSLFGLSNIQLNEQIGSYFGDLSGQNPFTHTWSLAVEEQFYFFYIFLFVILTKNRNYSFKKLQLSIIFFTFVSLFLYLQDNILNIGKSFFLFPYRYWEIGLGCLLALNMNRVEVLKSKPIALFSLTTIFFLFFVSVTSYSFVFNILIVLASLLFLSNIRDLTYLKIFFQNRLLIYIGKLSYSLYLFHWPIIVFSKNNLPSSPIFIFAQVILTFLLSIIIYEVIEKKKNINFLTPSRILLLNFILAISIYGFYKYDKLVYLGKSHWNPNIYMCDKSKMPNTLIIGDSHTRSLAVAIAKATDNDCYHRAEDFTIFTYDPIGLDANTKEPLMEINFKDLDKVKSFIKKERVKNLVIEHYLQGAFSSQDMSYQSRAWLIGSYISLDKEKIKDYKTALLYFTQQVLSISQEFPSLKIFLLLPLADFNWRGHGGGLDGNLCHKEWFRPFPKQNERCKQFLTPESISIKKLEVRRSHINEALRNLSSQANNITLIDPVPAICSKTRCSTHDKWNNTLYNDDDHINYNGAIRLAPLFKKYLVDTSSKSIDMK